MIRQNNRGDLGAAGYDESNFAERVVARFGLFPNFFRTAKAAPQAIEDVFAFAQSAYLDNPLPSLFKERLFVQLSRFCETRYCIVRHTGFLIGCGRPAGDASAPLHSIDDVAALLLRPLTPAVRLSAVLDRMEALDAPMPFPAPASPEEADVFDALTALFVSPRNSDRTRNALRRALGAEAFDHICVLVAYIRLAHNWTEMHPEIAFESDILLFMEAHPRLASTLLNVADTERARAASPMHAVLDRLRRSDRALRASEDFARLACHAGRMGTWRIDTRNELLTFDATFAALLGLPEKPSSITLREFTTFVGPLAGASLSAVASAAVPENRSVDVELHLQGQDGTRRWIRLSGRAQVVERWMVQGVAFDVSGRRTNTASRETESAPLSVAGSIAQATWETDGAGSMSLASPSWRAYTGQSVEQCLGYGWLDAIHPEDREDAERRWRRGVAAGRNIDTEFRVHCAITADYRWTNVLACPIVGADGTATKWVGMNIDIDDRKRAQNALRDSEQRLAGELADVRTLQRISTELIPEQPTEALYERMLDAAMELMDCQAASLQTLTTDGTLTLLASRGFSPLTSDHWQTVDASRESTCGKALLARERIIIDDVEQIQMADAELAAYRASGLRSAQSTPLVSQSGAALGMISTQWARPQAAHERDFARFDVLARLVADILQRSQTETMLRQSEELQASLVALDDTLRPLSDMSAIVMYANAFLAHRIDESRPATLVLPARDEEHPNVDAPDCAVESEAVARPAHEQTLIDAIAERTSLALNRVRAEGALRESRRRASEAVAYETLRRRLVLAEEEQRRRFARELHDEAGQHLAALNLGLERLSGCASPGSEVERRAHDLRALAGTLSAEIHALALRLRPRALDDFGLAAALRSYTQQWAQTSGIAVDLHVPSVDERLSPDVEAALYRIVQEALTNVAAHSGAKRAGVILEHRGNEVLAIVEDDGCGFDTSIAAHINAGGLGLLGIKERVELLRGVCEIESAPGRGATVLVRLPASLHDERTTNA